MRTNATPETVKKALEQVNKEHGYKLEFNRFEIRGNWTHFTIKSEKSGIPGSRYSWSGRKLVSASWHAHGYLFENILEIEPNCRIWSNGKKIDKTGGNWQDTNIGSLFQPCYFSDTSIL